MTATVNDVLKVAEAEVGCVETSDPKLDSTVCSVKKCTNAVRSRRALYCDKHYKASRSMRTCTSCNETKSRLEYYGHKALCKSCISVRNRTWRIAHPEEYQKKKEHGLRALITWETHLRNRYGISHEDWLVMYEKQEGKCAGCGSERLLVVDHCHTTGEFRGLLCRKCNLRLGWIEGSIEIVVRLIKYLEDTR